MSRTSRLHQARLQIESLEGRALPAQVEWINPAGGDWAVPSNWSTGQLPGADDDVVIDLPEEFAVRHLAGTTVVHSLLSRETLLLFGGILTPTADSVFDGPVELLGGSLDGTGALTSNSFFSWGAGDIRGSGPDARLVANHSLSIYGPGSKMLAGRSLEITRSSSMSGGPLVLNQAAFTVGPLAYVEMLDGAQLREEDASRFTNLGAVYLRNGGEIATHWVTNNGHLEVDGGRLNLGNFWGSVSMAGSIQLGAQANVSTLSDFIHFNAVIGGAGNLIFRSGNVGFYGQVDLDGLVSVGGTSSVRIGGSLHVRGLEISTSYWTVSGEIVADEVYLGGGISEGDVTGSLTAHRLNFGGGYTILSGAAITAEVFESDSSLELRDTTVVAQTVLNRSRFFLQGATVVSVPTFVNRGWLNGAGTINGDVINESWVMVGGLSSVGVLRINGNFIQTMHGELFVWLGGTEPGTGYSHLEVNGLAILGGSLVVRVQDGFAPQEGDSFAVLNFAGRLGRFASIDVPQFEDDVFLDPTYGDASLALLAVRR